MNIKILISSALSTLIILALPFLISQDIDVYPFHFLILIVALIYGFKLRKNKIKDKERSKGIGILLGCGLAIILEITFLVYLDFALKG